MASSTREDGGMTGVSLLQRKGLGRERGRESARCDVATWPPSEPGAPAPPRPLHWEHHLLRVSHLPPWHLWCRYSEEVFLRRPKMPVQLALPPPWDLVEEGSSRSQVGASKPWPTIAPSRALRGGRCRSYLSSHHPQNTLPRTQVRSSAWTLEAHLSGTRRLASPCRFAVLQGHPRLSGPPPRAGSAEALPVISVQAS